ncbi:MAG: DUF4276 family protein [Planctomycetaceae bacterium]|nr:DUF4276 family protein [Planctomycetaceae bacterium]
MKVLLVAEGKHELGGALQTLVRRLISGPIEFTDKPINSDEVHTHHGKGRGFVKRAIRWMLTAEADGYDALILLIDEDEYPERIREIAEAQSHNLGISRRALGIAIHTFDSWMLASETAISKALGIHIATQRDPESISDPKSVFMALRDQSGLEANLPELYAIIASHMDMEQLETRCPKGFGTFATRVRAL